MQTADVTAVPDVGATIGVEEEFHLVDPETGLLTNGAAPILLAQHGTVVEPELQRSMIETTTPVCLTIGELAGQIRASRRSLLDAADRAGLWVAAAGTVPGAGRPSGGVYPNPRYERMAEQYRQLVAEQQVCACQVQVGIPDRETAVLLIRRIRVWLSALLALSSGSPFFLDGDTGYASYRTIVNHRWPSGGPPPHFGSAEEYDRTIARLLRTGVINDRGMVYFDIRASARYPTLEVRIADACPSVSDVVLLSALSRALIVTAAADEEAGLPVPFAEGVLLRAASWRAARSGMTGQLIDPVEAEPMPAWEFVDRLLTHIRPALEHRGDWDLVSLLLAELRGRGTSAERQRAAYRRADRVEDVVESLVAETRTDL